MKHETEKWLQEAIKRQACRKVAHAEHGTWSAEVVVADIDGFLSLVTEQAAMLRRWKSAVEGLTPLGSEYVDDPEACAAAIRERCRYPKQIIELRTEIESIRSEANREDDEIRRLQDGIRDHLITLGVPADRIDGAGCDSGDPLDFTKAEITQAFSCFTDRAVEVVERKRDEWQIAIEFSKASAEPFQSFVAAANEILAELKGEG